MLGAVVAAVTEGVGIGLKTPPLEVIAAQPDVWRDRFRRGEAGGVARRIHKLVTKHYVEGPSLKPMAVAHNQCGFDVSENVDVPKLASANAH